MNVFVFIYKKINRCTPLATYILINIILTVFLDRWNNRISTLDSWLISSDIRGYKRLNNAINCSHGTWNKITRSKLHKIEILNISSKTKEGSYYEINTSTYN